MSNKFIVPFFFSLIFLLSSSVAQAASIGFSVNKSNPAVGDTLIVNLKIDTGDVSINAAQATVMFPNNILKVESVDRGSSVFNFWLAEPSFDNNAGTVSFSGAGMSGYSGKSLQILQIKFRVIGNGDANLAFSAVSIFASDGKGTNVYSTSGESNFSALKKPEIIKPPVQIMRPAKPAALLPDKPVLSVLLYPNPESWYNLTSNFSAKWSLPDDVTDVATNINQVPISDPAISEGLFDNKNYEALSSGVYYIHVRFKNNIGWGPTANYRIAIDTDPPSSFRLQVSEGLSTYIQTLKINYASGDGLSGIDYYSITVNNNSPIITNSDTYVLPPQLPGEHLIRVYAFDKAGNAVENSVSVLIKEVPLFIFGGISFTKTGLFLGTVLALLLGFGVRFFYHKLWMKQLGRKVFVSQLDVTNAFSIIRKDTNKMLEGLADGSLNTSETAEIEFLLKKMEGRLEKTQKYIVDNISEINK